MVGEVLWRDIIERVGTGCLVQLTQQESGLNTFQVVSSLA